MMVRAVLLAILLLLVVRAINLLLRGITGGGGPSRPRVPAQPVKLVRDPVCGTHVPPRPSLSLASGGTTHYFCSEECRAKFGKP
jgi:YHS domain-containing protein